MPPDFLGSYYLKMGNARTALLSTSDGPPEIEKALGALARRGERIYGDEPAAIGGEH